MHPIATAARVTILEKTHFPIVYTACAPTSNTMKRPNISFQSGVVAAMLMSKIKKKKTVCPVTTLLATLYYYREGSGLLFWIKSPNFKERFDWSRGSFPVQKLFRKNHMQLNEKIRYFIVQLVYQIMIRITTRRDSKDLMI